MITTTNSVSNTQVATSSTFNLPTSIVDKTVNTVNNLSTTNKIIAGSIAGVIFLGLVGMIAYCCYRCRTGRRFGQRRRMQISYPLVPLSPTLRRRR